MRRSAISNWVHAPSMPRRPDHSHGFFAVPALALVAVLIAILASTSIQAEIYRCIDDEGRTEFSDRPCADDAEIVELEGNMSVIAAADSLDAAAQANRQFIDQRLADLAEQRRAAAERQRVEAAQQRSAALRQAASQQRSIPLSLQDQRRLLAQRRAERIEADQRRREQAESEPAAADQRRTLLSRSGGNRQRILD